MSLPKDLPTDSELGIVKIPGRKTIIPTALPEQDTKKVIQIKQMSTLPIIERRNWLLHFHFVRKEYTTCKSLIKEQLKESKGLCEYAVYIQAMILRNEGDIQSSLELFQACHLLNPGNPDNLKQVARNLILLGKHRSAIDCYNKAAEIGNKDWNVCHCLGLCYHFLKESEQAVQCYNEALNKSKKIVTYEALAQLYMENEDLDQALDVLLKASEFAPENTDFMTSLGMLYLQKDDFHRAFELLGQVLTYDPENYKALLAVSSLMQRHEDFDVALSKYRIAAHNCPESSPVWNNVGMCYFGKNKIIPAISCLKRAYYHSPFDWKILYNLSLLHITTQQYTSAFLFASTAAALKRNHAPIYMLLAIALTNLEQTENAGKAYDEAMKLDPNNIYLQVNYCIFLHNINQNQQAAAIMSSFMSKYDEEQLSKIDKEMADICKKLTAALHLGDRVVAEKARTQKSNTRVQSKTSIASEEMAPRSQENIKREIDVPSVSSGSAFVSPKRLPPLLPPLSSGSNITSARLNAEKKPSEKLLDWLGTE